MRMRKKYKFLISFRFFFLKDTELHFKFDITFLLTKKKTKSIINSSSEFYSWWIRIFFLWIFGHRNTFFGSFFTKPDLQLVSKHSYRFLWLNVTVFLPMLVGCIEEKTILFLSFYEMSKSIQKNWHMKRICPEQWVFFRNNNNNGKEVPLIRTPFELLKTNFVYIIEIEIKRILDFWTIWLRWRGVKILNGRPLRFQFSNFKKKQCL